MRYNEDRPTNTRPSTLPQLHTLQYTQQHSLSLSLSPSLSLEKKNGFSVTQMCVVCTSVMRTSFHQMRLHSQVYCLDWALFPSFLPSSGLTSESNICTSSWHIHIYIYISVNYLLILMLTITYISLKHIFVPCSSIGGLHPPIIYLNTLNIPCRVIN